MINMKRKIVFSLLGSVLAVTMLFGLYVYFTEFYYAWPDYALTVRTGLDGTYRNVNLKILPKGEFDVGLLGCGGDASYEDPRWPLPEKFLLSFDDPEGKHHELEAPSDLKKGFRGRITMILKKNEEGYYVDVETSPLNR